MAQTMIPRTTVTTGEPDRRYVRDPREQVSIRLGRTLRRDLDAFAAEQGMNRTTLIEEAVRLYMAIKSVEMESHAAD